MIISKDPWGFDETTVRMSPNKHLKSHCSDVSLMWPLWIRNSIRQRPVLNPWTFSGKEAVVYPFVEAPVTGFRWPPVFLNYISLLPEAFPQCRLSPALSQRCLSVVVCCHLHTWLDKILCLSYKVLFVKGLASLRMAGGNAMPCCGMLITAKHGKPNTLDRGCVTAWHWA